MMKDLLDKLRILADSAKYDVSCASSGVQRESGGRIGSAMSMGICHSWSADGRCISLLKVLFTNKCVYDCQYCVNRRSADVERASFEPEELARLVVEFYRRNYIEGLFLSSAVEVSPDHTAERIIRAISILREREGFYGYIHAKIAPGVSPELVRRIGLLADRLSVNIELPTEKSLQLLAPQKKMTAIAAPMRQIAESIQERKGLRYGMKPSGAGFADVPVIGEEPAGYGDFLPASRESRRERFAPAGQSTQMIIGATPETDRRIIRTTESLYRAFSLKRVYFSAYIPVGDATSGLLPPPTSAPPLRREHRLYQADWLLRYYAFSADEILDENSPFLDLELDPKIAWALRHIRLFPIEINKASYEELLRIPGIGTVSAQRILRQRRLCAVKFDDLRKLGVIVKRAQYFMTCCGRYYGATAIDPARIRSALVPSEAQLSMFEETALAFRGTEVARHG